MSEDDMCPQNPSGSRESSKARQASRYVAPPEDHNEIWLEPKAKEYAPEGRLWCQDDVWPDGVKYLRADMVDELIEEAREEERFEAASLWPEWADKLLKILRAYGVPCDDEEGVDLPEELREWLSNYKHEMRRVSDGSREAGETKGLDPQDDSAVGNAETPQSTPTHQE